MGMGDPLKFRRSDRGREDTARFLAFVNGSPNGDDQTVRRNEMTHREGFYTRSPTDGWTNERST